MDLPNAIAHEFILAGDRDCYNVQSYSKKLADCVFSDSGSNWSAKYVWIMKSAFLIELFATRKPTQRSWSQMKSVQAASVSNASRPWNHATRGKLKTHEVVIVS
eukprot:5888384-Pleurochrysis_carterae.AAC.3